MWTCKVIILEKKKNGLIDSLIFFINIVFDSIIIQIMITTKVYKDT